MPKWLCLPDDKIEKPPALPFIPARRPPCLLVDRAKNGHDAMRHRVELLVYWRTDKLCPDGSIGISSESTRWMKLKLLRLKESGRNATHAALGEGLAVSAFPLFVPV